MTVAAHADHGLGCVCTECTVGLAGYLVTIAQAHGVNYMPPVRLDEADL